jgi:hypothetical protein
MKILGMQVHWDSSSHSTTDFFPKLVEDDKVDKVMEKMI